MDTSQLQKALKQMHEMAEENRKLTAFMAEIKADTEKVLVRFWCAFLFD